MRAACRSSRSPISRPISGRPSTRRSGPSSRRFRDIVVSGEEKLLKPDPAIYYRALDRFRLTPGRGPVRRRPADQCRRRASGRDEGASVHRRRGPARPAGGRGPALNCSRRARALFRRETKMARKLWIVRHGQSAGNVARDAADAAGLADDRHRAARRRRAAEPSSAMRQAAGARPLVRRPARERAAGGRAVLALCARAADRRRRSARPAASPARRASRSSTSACASASSASSTG